MNGYQPLPQYRKKTFFGPILCWLGLHDLVELADAGADLTALWTKRCVRAGCGHREVMPTPEPVFVRPYPPPLMRNRVSGMNPAPTASKPAPPPNPPAPGVRVGFPRSSMPLAVGVLARESARRKAIRRSRGWA